MTASTPLDLPEVKEVPLPQAPLVRVLAQARFPPILAIRIPEEVARWQEKLRAAYPHLSKEEVHSIELTGGEDPKVDKDLIWRLADSENDTAWQVSLGVNFVALDTTAYENRADFLERLRAVVAVVEDVFGPASTSRLGLRYIDQLTGEAVDRIGDLVHPEVLGIIQPPSDGHVGLRDSVVGVMTQVQFCAREGFGLQGRWGRLPADTTYDHGSLEAIGEDSWILDLDMFTTEPQPFESETLLTMAGESAETLYRLFRHMVNDEFLRFYGGTP